MGGVAYTYLHINLERKCRALSAGINQFQWKFSDGREAANSSSLFLPAGRYPFAARKIFFKSHHSVEKVGQKTTGEVQTLEEMEGATVG